MKTLKDLTSWLNEEFQEPGTPTDDDDEIRDYGKFSIEELHKRTELLDIINYVNGTLGQAIGGGVARKVWVIDEHQIIKVINYEGEEWQNKNEVDNAWCLGEELAVKVLDNHENFFWIIEERLKVLGEEETLRIIAEKLGFKLKNWRQLRTFFKKSVDWINNGDEGFSPSDLMAFKTIYKRSEWYQSLIGGLSTCEVKSSDFHDENWGYRESTGQLVLLDLGF